MSLRDAFRVGSHIDNHSLIAQVADRVFLAGSHLELRWQRTIVNIKSRKARLCVCSEEGAHLCSE